MPQNNPSRHSPEKNNLTARLFATLCLSPLLAASLHAAPAPSGSLWQPRLPVTQANNLVPNSSFELGTFGWSSLGQETAWGGDLSTLYGTVTTKEKFDGERSFEITLGPGKTLVTSYDTWPPATVVQHSPLAVNLGWITVQPGETYTLSAYMKADRPGVPARLVMRFGNDLSADPHPTPKNSESTVTLTEKWERYSFTFKAEDLSVCVGVGPDMTTLPNETATVWIDAIQFEKKSKPSAYGAQQAVEVAIESGLYGNVYSTKAPAKLRVAALNRTARPTKLDVVIALKDYFDRSLPELHHTVTVPANGTVEENIALKLPGTGYYRASVTATFPGGKHEAAFPLALIKDYNQPDAVFGINHAPSTPEMLSQFRRAGMMWARDWSFDWQEVEPQKGKFTWEEPDRDVARLIKADWKILGLLPGFASSKWASSVPADHLTPPGAWRGHPDWVWMSAAPKDPNDLANYVKAVAERYKDRVKVWEFLNEPGTVISLPSPSRGVPGFTYVAQDYVNLLKVASTALKEADPTAKLVGGYSLEILHRAPEFIRAGGLKYIDILNIHPYGFFEAMPEYFIPQLQELLALMDASPEGRKPIWATEGGYYAEDDKPRLPWVEKGHPFAMDNEKLAADFTLRHAIIMLAHGVEKIFYHTGTQGDVNNGLRDLGNPLLGPKGTPQKVFPAYAFLANLLGTDFKYVGPMAKPERVKGLSTDTVFGYAFQCGKKAVLVAWAPEEWQNGHEWSLKVPRDVEAYDIVGTHLTEGGNGKTVVLGDSVVYLVTELMTATDLARAQMVRADAKPPIMPPTPMSSF